MPADCIARVVSCTETWPGAFVLWLHAPPLAVVRPGQFALLRCSEGLDPFLRRPLSLHRRGGYPGRPGGQGEIAFLFRVAGRGTELLAGKRPGDDIGVFGPLGRGYALAASVCNVLLVAGGIGIAPLVALADEAEAAGRSVVLLYGAESAGQMYPRELLPPEVEVHLATEDGSAGHKGLVTGLFEEFLPWADAVCACGPVEMYRQMRATTLRAGGHKPVQVLLEQPMACGIGACYSCTVQTRRGPRRVCRDGPRFELRDVE